MKKKLLFGIIIGISMSMIFTSCSGETNKDEESITESSVVTTETSATQVSDESNVANVSENEIPEETGVDIEQLPVINVNSSNVTDGVWDTKITNTTNGENLSPELSWSSVEGALGYEVYMIDTDANWLHLLAYTTDTSFEMGQIDGTDGNKYIGPYPPSGTHHYVVYVVAIKANPGDVITHYDSGYNHIEKYVNALNIDENGNEGNVIGFGLLEATYTYGD